MHFLDLRGVSCPTNFVKIKLTLEDLDDGEEVRVLLDDGDPVVNVPRSLKAEGHTIISLTKTDEDHFQLDFIKSAV